LKRVTPANEWCDLIDGNKWLPPLLSLFHRLHVALRLSLPPAFDMDDLADQTPETLTRVGDLWFSKDMIVIRAENKIFHVFGGILAAKSIVFRDMLAFPQPSNGGIEQIDGSLVVRLHDSADDVEAFLRAIYDSRCVALINWHN
jgi:hypothetical protein